MKDSDTGAQGKAELMAGILREAEAEAGRILGEAEEYASQQEAGSGQRAARILEEAGEKAREQCRAIERQAASAVRVETRRRALRAREQVIRKVLERARRALAERVDRPEYRRVLEDWVVEAAVGLAVPEAEVSCSGPERALVDQKLLAEAARRVKELTGREVKLRLSEDEPPAAQGVVLSAPGGRVQFNNQVRTRLLRRQAQVREAVYSELFTDGEL